jgi:two-component system response regulator TrcR
MHVNASMNFSQWSLTGWQGMARILVAEDNTSLLGAIRDTLELGGYSVCGVTNGVQAIEAFSRFRPELIVADVVMPEMDGFELYRRVRRESPDMAIPFVFISAREEAQAVQQVAGNNSTYLRKPFGPEELLEAVCKFLG